jgi:hypothetical protein
VVITQLQLFFRTNLTAQSPITKLARVIRKKQERTYKQNIKQDSSCSNGNNMIIIIPLKSIIMTIIIQFLTTEQPKGQCYNNHKQKDKQNKHVHTNKDKTKQHVPFIQ